MRLKTLFSIGFAVFLAGLIIFYVHHILSITDGYASAVAFLTYVIALSIGCAVFLIIDAAIRFRNMPDYFRKETARNIILSAAFFMIVLLPVIGLILGTESSLPTHEKRQLARKPSLINMDISAFTKDFHSYFQDNYGFRKTWMTLNNYVKVKYFKVSPLSKVIMGKDGWLFFDESLHNAFGGTTAGGQIREITNSIERQNAWFAGKGIYYVFVIVPDKETVYPEYLPDSVNITRQKTMLDQVMFGLGPDSNVHIIDLRASFLKAKTSNRLYYKTDTHWNSYGAFIGYLEIMKQLSARFPDLKPPLRADVAVQNDAITYSGDLAHMLSLGNQLTEKGPGVVLTQNRSQAKLRKAVIFKDSYFDNLKPYLSPRFREMIPVSFTDKFDSETLETDPPEIVITICVQRNISLAKTTVNNWLSIK
ncbi:MAG: hypothetical protein K4571_09005 [Deltaproteobacteria bacterium]